MYYILYNLLFEKHFYQSHPQSKLEKGRCKTGDHSFNTDIEITHVPQIAHDDDGAHLNPD